MSHPDRLSCIRTVLALVCLAAFLASPFPCKAEVPRTFSYQGVLTNAAGAAVPDGNYSMTFLLYEVPIAGSPLWSETHPAVTVSKGIFNVILGTAEPMLPPFDAPYWLAISVEGGSELAPRTPLTSTAYSIRAENADRVNDIGASWTPAANALLPLGADAKFPASVLPTGLPPGPHASTHNESGSDVITVTSALIQNGAVTSGKLAPPLALEATTNFPVIGGTNYGSGHCVFGEAVDGCGVVGTSTNNFGVYGVGSNFPGVYGYTSSGMSGVYGEGGSSSYGLYGFGSSGVYGSSNSSNGNGLVGTCNNGSLAYGVWGSSSTGYGVFADGPTGVYGQSYNDAGQAVYGHGFGTNTEGVLGVSEQNIGVYGMSNASSGNNFGVWGQSNSGTGVYASTSSGTAVYAFGSFVATGTKSAEVRLEDGTPIRLFSEEATEVCFADYGNAALSGGRAHVELDPTFLQTVTIDDRNPMKVFVQLEGDCNGVFVTNKSATGFDVVELQGGTSSAPFSYRVVCKRKYYEDERLATAEQEAASNRRMLEKEWPDVLARHRARQDELKAGDRLPEQHRLKLEKLQAIEDARQSARQERTGLPERAR